MKKASERVRHVHFKYDTPGHGLIFGVGDADRRTRQLRPGRGKIKRGAHGEPACEKSVDEPPKKPKSGCKTRAVERINKRIILV